MFKEEKRGNKIHVLATVHAGPGILIFKRGWTFLTSLQLQNKEVAVLQLAVPTELGKYRESL